MQNAIANDSIGSPENMTLAELKEQGVDWIEMAGPMRDFAGMEHNGRDGRFGLGPRR